MNFAIKGNFVSDETRITALNSIIIAFYRIEIIFFNDFRCTYWHVPII